MKERGEIPKGMDIEVEVDTAVVMQRKVPYGVCSLDIISIPVVSFQEPWVLRREEVKR